MSCDVAVQQRTHRQRVVQAGRQPGCKASVYPHRMRSQNLFYNLRRAVPPEGVEVFVTEALGWLVATSEGDQLDRWRKGLEACYPARQSAKPSDLNTREQIMRRTAIVLFLCLLGCDGEKTIVVPSVVERESLEGTWANDQLDVRFTFLDDTHVRATTSEGTYLYTGTFDSKNSHKTGEVLVSRTSTGKIVSVLLAKHQKGTGTVLQKDGDRYLFEQNGKMYAFVRE